ncbi:hypothetical protein [Streptomyces sp. NPDC000880]
MQVKVKKRTISAGIACVIAAGGVIGYQQIFTKGLDRLPAKPCSGAVDRSTAASALPTARKAEERGKLTTSTSNGQFTFYCYVRTDDSTISGEAESGFATASSWLKSRESERVDGAVAISAGDVKALALPNLATVYVPCTPPQGTDEPHRPHSLVVEARTIGETRVQHAALRQVVVDFAYQLAQHAYKAGKCQEPRKFPNELPRIRSN